MTAAPGSSARQAGSSLASFCACAAAPRLRDVGGRLRVRDVARLLRVLRVLRQLFLTLRRPRPAGCAAPATARMAKVVTAS